MKGDTANRGKRRASSKAPGSERRRAQEVGTDENHSSPANNDIQNGKRASSRAGVKKQRRRSVVCWICALVCCKGTTAETESYPQTPEIEMQEYDTIRVASPSSFGRFSEEDISKDLKTLNGKLHGAGTYMAECLARGFEFENATKERVAAVQRVSNCIGSVLGTSLGTGAPKDKPMLLQNAFQACLASALYRIASANLNDDTDRDSLWAESPTKQTIIADIADIMLAASCNAARDDLSSKIASEFEEKISSLVELARRLQTMLKQKSDFEVFIARSGGKFDGTEFEDENADDTESVTTQSAPVLCTTSIGLIKQIPSEMGQKERVVVLKANVLLESFLD